MDSQRVYTCVADYLLRNAKRDRWGLPIEPDPTDLVYFVGATEGGPVKIGRSRNLEKRLGALQTASPDLPHLLALVPGGKRLERAYHDAFSHLRIRGEWFRRDEIMGAEIRYWRRGQRRRAVWDLAPTTRVQA